jgi:hypothetical protein
MAQKRKHIKVQIKVLDQQGPEKEDEEAQDSSSSEEDSSDTEEEEEDEAEDDNSDEQPGKKQKLDDVLDVGPFVTYFATIKPERGEELKLPFEVFAAKDPEERDKQPMYLVSPQVGSGGSGGRPRGGEGRN